MHELVFQTEAECSEDYFRSVDVSERSVGEYNERDTCIYTTHRYLEFSKEGRRGIRGWVVGVAVVGLVGVAGLVWWGQWGSRKGRKRLDWRRSDDFRGRTVDESEHDRSENELRTIRK
jgi:hypothetical protein